MSDVNFKHHFKLEFDVKTNNADALDLLRTICNGVKSNLELHFPVPDIEVLPTVTVIVDGEDGLW